MVILKPAILEAVLEAKDICFCNASCSFEWPKLQTLHGGPATLWAAHLEAATRRHKRVSGVEV